MSRWSILGPHFSFVCKRSAECYKIRIRISFMLMIQSFYSPIRIITINDPLNHVEEKYWDLIFSIAFNIQSENAI